MYIVIDSEVTVPASPVGIDKVDTGVECFGVKFERTLLNVRPSGVLVVRHHSCAYIVFVYCTVPPDALIENQYVAAPVRSRINFADASNDL